MLYCLGKMPTVFIVARDWMLRVGVRAELREMGVEALGMESADDAAQALAAGQTPSAVVIEARPEWMDNPAIQNLARRVPAVIVASRTESAAFASPAAAILYRPVRVGDVVARVRQILQGYAA
jgi:DNA-binding response OmpR family regulator